MAGRLNPGVVLNDSTRALSLLSEQTLHGPPPEWWHAHGQPAPRSALPGGLNLFIPCPRLVSEDNATTKVQLFFVDYEKTYTPN